MWNRVTFHIPESTEKTPAEILDSRRAIFSGDGAIEPPAADEGHVDLHDMGAKFRAHWLGLLGFESVVNRDYPVMFATLYIFTLFGLVIKLVSDLTRERSLLVVDLVSCHKAEEKQEGD